jgi:hypothetical protein
MFGFGLPSHGAGSGSALTYDAIAGLLPPILLLSPKALVLGSDQFLVSCAIALGLVVCWVLPSSTDIAARLDSDELSRRSFYLLAVGVGVLAFIASLSFADARPSPFIYYQF